MRIDGVDDAAQILANDLLWTRRSDRKYIELGERAQRLPRAVRRPAVLLPAAAIAVSDLIGNLARGSGSTKRAQSLYQSATGKTARDAAEDLIYASQRLLPLAVLGGEETLLRSAASRLLRWVADGREPDAAMEAVESAFRTLREDGGGTRDAYEAGYARLELYGQVWRSTVDLHGD